MSKSEAKPKAKPVLAITPGEPAGIGPDLFLLLDPSACDALLLGIADPDMLQDRASQLGLKVTLNITNNPAELKPDCLNVWPVPICETVVAGQLNSANGPYVLATLECAVSLCEQGIAQAIVTGPVNKAMINESGVPFSGHTEWLAERTGTPRVVMMLASGNLRVTLATTHLPLRAVPDAIQTKDLVATLQIIHTALTQRFGITSPRIMVCGLNPHAGESGHLGREEIDQIEPAIQQALALGIQAFGPVPADTAFTPRSLKDADTVLAMYHDQGLPVLKHAGFGDAVNITLGLPLIRTSVDHGTALDLAATGKAEPDSFIKAIETAVQLINSSLREPAGSGS